jgi:hypothetical protein
MPSTIADLIRKLQELPNTLVIEEFKIKTVNKHKERLIIEMPIKPVKVDR